MGSVSKILVLLFFCIILINAVFAFCEYSDIEKYTEFGKALCLDNSRAFYAEALVIADFINGTRPSFTVSNLNSFQVKAYFNYTVTGYVNVEKFYGIPINGKDQAVIYAMCYANDITGNCSIVPASVSYFITQPKNAEICMTDVPKIRELINKPCKKDSDCPTLCNIAGFCAKDKIPSCCPEGKTNCNNKACLTPSIKSGGEAYSCEWECKSGSGVDGVCKDKAGETCQKDADCASGICNVIKQCGSEIICPTNTTKCENLGCFIPGTKKYGGSYKCDWECKSQRGKDGICQPSIITIIILIILAVIVLLSAIWYFLIYKAGKILVQIKRLNLLKKSLNEEVSKFKTDISELDTKAKDSKKEIDFLIEKKRNAEGDAKREFDEQLKKEEQNYTIKLEDLKNKYGVEMNFYTKKLESINEETALLKEKQKKWKEKAKNAKGDAKKKLDREYELLKKESDDLEKLERDVEKRRINASEKKKEIEELEETNKENENKLMMMRAHVSEMEKKEKDTEKMMIERLQKLEHINQKIIDHETELANLRNEEIKTEKVKHKIEKLKEHILIEKENLENERDNVEELKKKRLNKYLVDISDCFGKNRVAVNGNGYPIFSDSGNEIHRWFYRGQYEEEYGDPFDERKEVHHIDHNKYNSLNFWNLIDLTEEEHDKIEHSRLIRGEWKKNLKIMMKLLNWTEEQLPKHIREHLDELNTQKTLELND
jgi:hypothetical protein